MVKQTRETIILGGGVSGLGAAYTLSNNKKQFLLITENIGGRVINNNGVNYGAYFATHQYKNLKPFMHFKKELKKTDVEFHRKGKAYKMLSLNFAKLFPQYLKFTFKLMQFRIKYNKFKKRCETLSQDLALKEDKILYHLYHEKSSQWINQNHLNNLIDNFVSEPLYGLTFMAPYEMSSFLFLQWSSEIFLHRVFEFEINWKSLTKNFNDSIVFEKIKEIKIIQSGYQIITNKKSYECKNLICSLPFWISDKLLKLNHKHTLVNAYMHHIQGSLRPKWHHKRMELFSPGFQPFALVEQIDGTFLLYSRHKDINLKEYFTDYRIIAEKYWEPAFASPHKLFSFDVQDNLTVIGDANVPGMEDSFITGIYAANKILKFKIQP